MDKSHICSFGDKVDFSKLQFQNSMLKSYNSVLDNKCLSRTGKMASIFKT